VLARELGQRCGYNGGKQALHSDAFKVSFEGDGASLLYLNPPYDTDPEHGRLEEKFLTRFANALTSGGVLVFLVPFYALAASARTLGLMFENVRCFRFPDPEFGGYKQVALFAEKRETALWEPDPTVVGDVEGWAKSVENMPLLGDVDHEYSLPASSGYMGVFTEWKVRPFDMPALLAATKPWTQSDRTGRSSPVPGIVPEGALDDLLVRQYPVAMPPRPAHIAAGIAAGVFNGARIEPDDRRSKLPALLVKGVFDKEFRKVDEKKGKNGETKAVIEVQQPKLVTTVLDLSTSKYVTVKSSGELTNSKSIEDFTMADLLAAYGKGLMARMLLQCPVQHDPARDGEDVELAPLTRPLFQAQKHATIAAVKLLGGPGKRRRRGKCAFVLGEIGSGKTSVALATALTVESRRTLVLCPPHLLTSWRNQISAVCPNVRAVVLNDVGDVAALAADQDPGPVVAILSRETAKLGHAYESVQRCGDCGEVPPPGDHAKKRATCETRRVLARGPVGRLVRALAVDLAHVFPEDMRVRQVLRGPLAVAVERWAARKRPIEDTWPGLVARGNLDRLLDMLLTEGSEDALRYLERILWADPVPELLLSVARILYAIGIAKKESEWSSPIELVIARRLLLALKDVDVAEFKALDKPTTPSAYAAHDAWCVWEKNRKHLYEDVDYEWSFDVKRNEDDGSIETRDGHKLGDRKLVLDVFAKLAEASLQLSRECGAPLYQAVPEPRRYPLATYIAKRCPRLFDLLVLDEGHEYATDGSAQEQAAHRLCGLGIPTLLLTGSVMNGYAASLFTNIWALSSDFRREFARDEQSRFIDRYGYRKRLVEDRDKATGEIVEYGSMSDRFERRERTVGDAPGVLPVFLLRYLLPLAVTLHKTDLAIDIPKCTELVERVAPEPEQDANFKELQTKLLAQIKADRFEPELAGKLWGAMAELPSYLDVATDDVGNTPEGRYEICYPESAGGGLVVGVDPLPAETLLPKERWLIEHLEKAFGEGRNVLIFAWHTKLLPRIARLVKKYTGQECPILVPEKVPTKKREDWITSEVVGRKRRALVCNPLTVQTGLNNLVYFADEVWLENPACNPVVYRQAVGRVDRISQTRPTSIVFPLYSGTTQEALHSLLLQKVGISMSADGLDGESAMQAAGIGEDGFSSFSVGRQLYELLTAEPKTSRKKRAA
jgi:hypothetical protein